MDHQDIFKILHSFTGLPASLSSEAEVKNEQERIEDLAKSVEMWFCTFDDGNAQEENSALQRSSLLRDSTGPEDSPKQEEKQLAEKQMGTIRWVTNQSRLSSVQEDRAPALRPTPRLPH